jgi:iron complex transport system substrate-binding protein
LSTPSTRKIETIHGSVEIPADATRIVALDFPIACALFDLGVTIVGRSAYIPAFAAYTDAAQDVAVVESDSGELDLEKVAALHPDLILSDDWKDPAKQLLPYDKLTAIAPTAVFEWQQAGGNWRSEADSTAEAVGRTPQLDNLKQNYADRCAAIKSAQSSVLTTTHWDLIDAGADSWDLYGPTSSHGKVLVDAGVQLGAGATQTDGYVQYSLERLDLLAKSDVIFTTTVSLPFLKAQSVFNNLPAAQAGRVFTTDLFFPASYGIALALLDAVETDCKQLA